eukprot:scaffold44566_cov336-Skeletonema_marinoi.AAC.1
MPPAELARGSVLPTERRSSPDWIFVGCKFSGTNKDEEDLKDGNFIAEGFEKGVEAHVMAELFPLVPVGDGVAGSTRTDALAHCFRCNAESIPEMSCGGGVQT